MNPFLNHSNSSEWKKHHGSQPLFERQISWSCLQQDMLYTTFISFFSFFSWFQTCDWYRLQGQKRRQPVLGHPPASIGNNKELESSVLAEKTRQEGLAKGALRLAALFFGLVIIPTITWLKTDWKALKNGLWHVFSEQNQLICRSCLGCRASDLGHPDNLVALKCDMKNVTKANTDWQEFLPFLEREAIQSYVNYLKYCWDI